MYSSYWGFVEEDLSFLLVEGPASAVAEEGGGEEGRLRDLGAEGLTRGLS
jgi:hypothetical protein